MNQQDPIKQLQKQMQQEIKNNPSVKEQTQQLNQKPKNPLEEVAEKSRNNIQTTQKQNIQKNQEHKNTPIVQKQKKPELQVPVVPQNHNKQVKNQNKQVKTPIPPQKNPIPPQKKTLTKSIKEDGVYSPETRETNSSTIKNGYSPDALIDKLYKNEDRLEQINNRIDQTNTNVQKLSEGLGGLIQHVNNITNQFNQSIESIKQVTEIINKTQGNIKQDSSQHNSQHNSQPSAEDIIKQKQQEQMLQAQQQAQQQSPDQAPQQAPDQAPQQPQNALQAFSQGAQGVTGILDRLLQFYMMTKSNQQPQGDPAQAFMSSLETSVGLLKNMNGLVSNLKNDWLKEERLMHQIRDKELSNVKKQKE